jgi:hypothetical protein
MQPWSLGSRTGRKTPPAGWLSHPGEVFGRAEKSLEFSTGRGGQLYSQRESWSLLPSSLTLTFSPYISIYYFN